MLKTLFSLFVIFFMLGCSTKNLSPINASDYFWSAEKEKNYEDAKKFVRENDKDDVKLQKSIDIKRYEFDKAIIDEGYARVPTRLYLTQFFDTKKSKVVEVSFDTFLVKTSDGWKVNLQETKKKLYLQVMKKFGSDIGKGLFEKIKEGLGELGEFQKAFRDVLKNISNSAKEVK